MTNPDISPVAVSKDAIVITPSVAPDWVRIDNCG